MVNKFRRFLKSLGGKHPRDSRLQPSVPPLQVESGLCHSSSSVAFHASTSRTLNPADLEARLETSGSLTGRPTSLTSHEEEMNGTIEWNLVLGKLPALVAECFTHPATECTTTHVGPLSDLLALLQQMAGHDQQHRLKQFYTGTAPGSSNTASSRAQRCTLFRQCRRTLLLMWQALVTHLRTKQSSVPLEIPTVYFQLIGMIMERVEFHVPPTCDADSTSPLSTTNPTTPKRSLGWLASFLSWKEPRQNRECRRAGPNGWTRLDNIGTPSVDPVDDATETARAVDLYRYLLVATFKYATATLESIRQHHRSYSTLVETRFFARIFAVCYFRVPDLQRAMLTHILHAYGAKDWLASPHARAVENPAWTAPRDAVQPWKGQTLAAALSRWTEYNGLILTEDATQEGTSTANVTRCAPLCVPSRQKEDDGAFVRQHPTLFPTTDFSLYFELDATADLRSGTLDAAPTTSWLYKLSHDGEFFSTFMGFVSLHAANTALGSTVVWTCVPGYTLLIRVSLLLLKEACWAKWLYVRDTCGPLPSSSMDMEPQRPDEERQPFELEAIRAVRTVLDNVVQLLRNHELLDTCVVAMYECTNVLHPRSVDVCLTRFEEWFSATAVLTEVGGMAKRRGSGRLVYRLPSTFRGHTFATGLRCMLASDNCEILSRTLLFLYHRMDYFEGELRQSILQALVQRHMTLFLHWSADVRSKYHHLLVYRLVRANRFVLDSPLDHLLLGKFALSSYELDRALDDRSNLRTNQAQHSCNPSMTAADLAVLTTEQALWRAFDACLAAIIHRERRAARQGNCHFQQEQQAARSRAVAFQTLRRFTTSASNATATTASVNNEGLPGGKPGHEVETLADDLQREPPYFLRYLPSDEVAILDDLRRLALSVTYPHQCQVYARPSLRSYADLLKQYYRELDTCGRVEPPPLGYC